MGAREEPIAQIARATTLDEVRAARAALVAWLRAHPHDLGARDAGEELSLLEEYLLAKHGPSPPTVDQSPGSSGAGAVPSVALAASEAGDVVVAATDRQARACEDRPWLHDPTREAVFDQFDAVRSFDDVQAARAALRNWLVAHLGDLGMRAGAEGLLHLEQALDQRHPSA